MRLLSPDEMTRLLPAETHAFRGPVPTQIVSSISRHPRPPRSGKSRRGSRPWATSSARGRA